MVAEERSVNDAAGLPVASPSSPSRRLYEPERPATAVEMKRPAAGTPPLQFFYATISGTIESGA